jgi:AcrR family transcriptional regulator
LFAPAKKQAQQTARQLLAGHCTLIAWWALRHAGVFDAMVKFKTERNESLQPLLHATRTNMAPDVLDALLQYLATANLVLVKKDGVQFTPEGQALYDNEDGILELVRAYQPILDMAEHLLAKLRGQGSGSVTGVSRKSEYLLESQAERFAAEVYPAIDAFAERHKFSHLLDLSCGTGELLMHILTRQKNTVGVGIGSDSAAVRKANDAITRADLDKRLIAVSANPIDICTDTQRTFDRIGVSRQLWKEFDCLIATGLLTDFSARPEEIVRILSAVARSFPAAHLMIIEPVDSPKFQKNYYAPELTLLMRLARSAPLKPEQWRDHFAAAKLKLIEEESLTTEGLTVFLCQTPAARPPAASPQNRIRSASAATGRTA